MSSLLTSLIQAGARFQQALEQGKASTGTATDAANSAGETTETVRNDTANGDRFTRTGQDMPDPSRQKVQQLALSDYKQTLGQDIAFVRETLRHKLAEYRQNPGTDISVTRNRNGRLALAGRMDDSARQQIEKDLNNNRNFVDAFRRLSASEPTLHFVDNAVRLSKAYGVSNTLLESLVSENQQFNGLQDLVHRYQSLRRNAGISDSSESGGYAFSLRA